MTKIKFREILQWLKKIGVVHLIKSYGGEDRKYLGYSIWYFQNGTKYQKLGPNTNLI